MTDEDRNFAVAVARRIVGEDDAPDVAQDALLVAHRKRAQFRGDSAYRTWLYRVVVTTSLACLRARRRSARHIESPHVDQAPSLFEGYALRETLTTVHRAIDALPAPYRELLQLACANDLTNPELADELGISVANVKIRKLRAQRALRGLLTAS